MHLTRRASVYGPNQAEPFFTQNLPGVCLDEQISRVPGLISQINSNYGEPRLLVAFGRATSPTVQIKQNHSIPAEQPIGNLRPTC
jgi:hypothetical protein